jgi:hypothetical protein
LNNYTGEFAQPGGKKNKDLSTCSGMSRGLPSRMLLLSKKHAIPEGHRMRIGKSNKYPFGSREKIIFLSATHKGAWNVFPVLTDKSC